MRFSRQFPSQQLLFTAVAALAAFSLSSWPTAYSQDTLNQNGTPRSGQIVGVRNGNIVLKMGPGEIGIPLAQATNVTMAAPPAVGRGLELQEAGKAAEALSVLKPVADSFGGLPLDWAQKSTAALGDLYLTLEKPVEAAEAYKKFKQLYPGAGLSMQADVGMARVAAAGNKLAEAKALLDPIVANALIKPDITKAESAAFGQAYFTLGMIAEKEGKPSDALQNYLRTVAIFYADRSITARAQERADALRKNGGVAVP